MIIIAKRGPRKQTIHDKKVAAIARKLQGEGWNVKADLPKYEQPNQIGKYVPDIEATKTGATRLIEVETEDSVEKDKDQIATFKRSAGHRKKTTFGVVIADES